VDDLDTPLKREGGGKRGGALLARLRRPSPMVLGGLVLAAVLLAGWLGLRNDPLGGEPAVTISLTRPGQDSGAAPKMRETLAAGDEDRGAQGEQRGDLPDAGQQADGGGDAPGGVVRITLPAGAQTGGSGQAADRGNSEPDSEPAARADGIKLARAPIRELVENAKVGPLPRISAAGRKASEAYARPRGPKIAGAGAPQVAILIGGLGISASASDTAIKQLPGEVSLAFAPYGRDLQRWVDKARQNGHEVALQLPMEPFDYPDNDPGPHTMLAASEPVENLTRLHWLLARVTGYFAVTNYMGAKFTANVPALRPVLKEVADRGLAYIDDGSSPRSVAPSLAGQIDLPLGSGDVIIDGVQTREAIAKALDRLELIARENGRAIGVGTALPATIEAVAEWSRQLSQRGLVLVPVSGLVAAAPRS